jgi:hypothetical protein
MHLAAFEPSLRTGAPSRPSLASCGALFGSSRAGVLSLITCDLRDALVVSCEHRFDRCKRMIAQIFRTAKVEASSAISQPMIPPASMHERFGDRR